MINYYFELKILYKMNSVIDKNLIFENVSTE